ncbi:MAG: CPBP family intramembrane glutamic endopeptidase [Cyclobacteriaceae bacterium]
MIEQLTLTLLILVSTVPIILLFSEKQTNMGKYAGLLTLYHLAYVALIFLPLAYSYLAIPGGSMNWTGKLLAILFSLVFYWMVRHHFNDHDFIVSPPLKGSIKKVTRVGLITIAVMCVLTVVFSKTKPLDIEKLSYQLTMPGLDEELWRGILLGLLLIILKDGKFKMGHPAVWVVTIIFALGHSLYFKDWELGFALDAFIITGALGFILGWMTIYSRSILLAIVFHNLINFSTNFIEMVIL